MDIILASTSAYRRALFARLQMPFTCRAPETDETPLPGESGAILAARLALAKADSVAAVYPHALVIGSDQVATLGDRLLGKPGNHATAVEQLLACSGKEVIFYTGLALVSEDKAFRRTHIEPFTACFKELSQEQIERYLLRDKPYDCAGSFKVESLGIALFTALRGDDPTSLEGLPLLQLCSMLAEAGVPVI